MEFKLFAVNCKNEKCAYEFITNSMEHTSCPSCAGDVVYSSDYVTATSNDIFSSDIESYMEDRDSVLAGIVVSLAYINGHTTVARYDDNYGFRLNIKESEYTDKLLSSLGISSVSQLKTLISSHMNAHESLIVEPIFECIERDSYCDESDSLYESGEVDSSTSKKFYNWILANTSYVADMLNE